jgi:hypothetical protein
MSTALLQPRPLPMPSPENRKFYSVVMEEERPVVWARHNMQNDKGKPITFQDRPWQKDMWDNTHPRQVSMKAGQVGETLRNLVRAIHSAAMHGRTCIYTMPTDGAAGKLVTGRLDRIINRSPYLRMLVGRDGKQGRYRPTDNTEQKHFGEGIIYFDGCKGEVGALAIPADELYHDEVDHSDQETLEMFRSRLLALPYQQRRVSYFSTPTVDKFGISKMYEDGDAKQWLVKCPGCSWEGPLDYWLHTEGRRLELHCSECDHILDPRTGRWVAQHPDRSDDVHSYHVVRMMDALPGNPDFLAGLHKEREKSIYTWHFDNMHLGVTSKAGVSTIDAEVVKRKAFIENYTRMLSADSTGQRSYFMGVDQGGTLTVLIGYVDEAMRIRIVWQERLRNAQRNEDQWDKLDTLMQRYKVELCVVDANPDGTKAHSFARRFPGRVLCCYYVESLETEMQIASDVKKRASGAVFGQVSVDEKVDVHVQRTEALDNTSTDIQSGGILLPGDAYDLENQEFLKHLEANIRKPVLGADGEPVYRWERTGTNDYFHSLNYLRIARTMGYRLSTLPGTPVAAPIIIGRGGHPRVGRGGNIGRQR